jgi:hypothetical protein
MPKVLYIGDSETVISRYWVGADVFDLIAVTASAAT